MSSDVSSIHSQFNLKSDKTSPESVYEFEKFRLNVASLMLYKDGQPVALAPKVVETLVALVERSGEVVSKREIMNRLWADSFVEEGNLTQNIYLLRKTLGRGADGRDLIETFRRRGYRFTGAIKKNPRAEPGAPLSADAETATPKMAIPPEVEASETDFNGGAANPGGTGGETKPENLPEMNAARQTAPRAGKSRTLAALALVLALLGGAALVIWIARAGTEPAGGAQIRTLAVMPFVNESGDANSEYLSDGITESLITSLSQLPDLSVKARGSALRYKDLPLRKIGSELSVQAILTGRIRERGGELVINVELADAQTENVLWKADYNRSMADLTALQSEIMRDVAQGLRIKLTGASEQRFARNNAADSETYRLYLKGRHHLNKIIPVDLHKAVAHFEQAIAQDRNFAPAYAGLAEAYVALAGFHGKDVPPPREFWAKAKEAAQRAVELDPQSAVTQIAYANVAKSFDYNLEESARACRTALQLDPSNAEAHALYGDILYYKGRDEEAMAAHRRALELDPLSMRNSIKFGFFLGSIKRDDEAVALMKKTMDLDPKLPTPHFVLYRLYMAKGMFAESVKEYTTVGRLLNFPESAKKLDEAFVRGGWEAFIKADLERVLEGQKSYYVRASDIAIYYAQLGDRDKTIEYLERAFYNREPLMIGLRRNRLFEHLRDDPRFTDLVRRIESK